MSAPSPSCPDDAAARRLARSMAVVSAFCLTGDTMLYIALPLFWQECGLTALWQVGVLLAVNRLVRLPLNPLVRLLYTRIDQRTGMALAVVLAASTTLLYGVAPVLCALAAAALPLGPGLDAPAPRLPVRPDGGLPQGQSRLSHGQLQRPRAPGQPAGHDRRRPPGRSAGLLHRGPALRRPDAGGPAAGPDPHPPQWPRHRSGKPGRHVPAFGPAPAPPRHAACLHHRTAGGPGLQRHLRRHPQPHGGPARGRAGPLPAASSSVAPPWPARCRPCAGSGNRGWRRGSAAFPTARAAGARCCAPALAAEPVRWPWWPCTCPHPLWLPLLLCSQLCATGLTTLSDAAASDTAARHGHPTHTLASYAFIVDCGAAAGPVLAYSVQDLWGMDAAYLAAAALLLCLLPLWMRREAAQARSLKEHKRFHIDGVSCKQGPGERQ